MGSTIVRVGSSIFGYRPKKIDGANVWMWRERKKTHTYLQNLNDESLPLISL